MGFFSAHRIDVVDVVVGGAAEVGVDDLFGVLSVVQECSVEFHGEAFACVVGVDVCVNKIAGADVAPVEHGVILEFFEVVIHGGHDGSFGKDVCNSYGHA